MNKLELIQALKDTTDPTNPKLLLLWTLFSMEWPMPWPKVIGWKSEDCVLFRQGIQILHWSKSQTGEKVKIKPKKLPFFKPGKELKERVDR